MAYSAGNLNVTIQAISKNTIKSLDEVLLRLNKISPVLQQITGISIPTSRGRRTSSTRSGGGLSLFSIGKWGAIIHSARRLAQMTSKMVQNGVDYTETLNLWSVTMRENLGLASQFVDKMNKAYGVSEQTLMNTQAIFKNMIGSLGQITDDVAYRLSESVTLLALDFASLYNVEIESAFEKFQAMLAGQVRPIRSAGGLDITETTLYQFYQEIGGTKTMRQLNRTEKQLLSILAVYKQMGTAGALGDMSKTLGNFANQSRMLNENFTRIATWTGLILEHLLTENEVIVYLNAHLIAIGEILKAIATGMGATKDDNAMTPLFETAEATNDEIDKLQGKLLDFDKFRALSGTENQATSVDTKLLEALTGYSSVIDMANNKAQDLAKTWIENAGGVEELVKLFKELGTVLLALITSGALLGIVKGIKAFAIASAGLQNIIVFGIVYSIFKMIEAFKDGDYWSGIIALTIGVTLVGALIAFRVAQTKTTEATKIFELAMITGDRNLNTYGLTINRTAMSIKMLGVALAAAAMSFMVFDSIIGGLDGTARKTVSIIAIVTGALATMLGVILAIKGGVKGGLIGATIAGLGVGALLAGIKGVATQNSKIEMHATGASNIDGGTLFVAGEMGKTEAVYTGSNGKTNVANVTQMEQAFYNALVRYGKNGNGQVVVNLDGQKIYENTTAHAKKEGRVWSKA